MENIKETKSPTKKPKTVNLPVFGFVMFLLGVFVLFGFRFLNYKTDEVHYHANFGLYINGQKDEFKNFTFYEEVAMCDVHSEDNVKGRAHMHDETPGLVHVEAHGVTWGQFFTNLGYTLGNKVIATDNGVYVDETDDNSLSFMLNGENTKNIEDKVIKNEDVLLINYGKDDSETLKGRYDSIPRNAQEANTNPDPAACGGSAGDSDMMQRLKASAGFDAH